MKFQSVVVPDGLIANLSGPYEGNGLLPLLEQHAIHNGAPLCLYGDPVYPLSVHPQGPYKDRQLTPGMELFNKSMSSVRVSVEWLFGSICNYFALIDMKKQQKVNLSAIGKIYIVSALLQNAHTCSYGNIVSNFFELSPPTLEQYISSRT